MTESPRKMIWMCEYKRFSKEKTEESVQTEEQQCPNKNDCRVDLKAAERNLTGRHTMCKLTGSRATKALQLQV